MATSKKSTKKAAVTEEVEDEDEATEATEAAPPQLHGGEAVPEGTGANGIVLTGVEQFGGRQGFVPAEAAEAAGISVTGKEEKAKK